MRAEQSRARIKWLSRFGNGCAIVCVPILITMFYNLIFSPFASKYEDYETEIAILRSTLGAAEEGQREHVRLKTEVADLQSLLKDVRERIPNSPNETLFLQQVTQAANDTNLHIRAYNRGRIAEFDTYSQLEVTIVGDGDYEGICRFIDRLAKMSRITSIEQLKIEAKPDSDVYPIDLRLLLFFNHSPDAKSTAHNTMPYRSGAPAAASPVNELVVSTASGS